ncbi:MAG: hypothetical protein ACYSWO_22410 [Planctomycetota bacterium]|jgi:hypothetical protein
MEVFSALIGAIIGAMVSFALAAYSKRKDEEKKVLTAIRSEVRLNLEVAEEVLKANAGIDLKGTDEQGRKWCDIIPFSDVGLIAVISTGGLSHLKRNVIEPVIRACTMVRRANFAAEKIKAGRYNPRKGREYYDRLFCILVI